MKNCLIYSLVYKFRHSDSKIMCKIPEIFKFLNKPGLILRYINHYILNNVNPIFIFLPHFYVKHRGYEIHYSFDSGLIRIPICEMQVNCLFEEEIPDILEITN